MKSLLFLALLWFALPFAPSPASAEAHGCQQLRNSVRNAVPPQARDLPYHALRCAEIGEIHLLIVRRDRTSGRADLARRIEAVFRRVGLTE